MLFPTITFAIFFLVVYAPNWLLMPRLRLWKWMIIAASYVFYGWWDWRFVLLLVAATIVNQGLGVQIAGRARGAAAGRRPALARPRRRRQPASARRLQVLRLLRREPQRRARRVRARRAAAAAAHHPAGRHLVPRVPHAHLRDRHLPRAARAGAGARLRRLRGLLPVPARRPHRARPRLPAAAHLAAGPARRGRVAARSCSSSAASPRRCSSPTTCRRTSSTGSSRRRSRTRRGRRCGASSPTPCRSTATSAPTATSPSASRCCSASSCPATSTRRTRRGPSRTSGAAGTSPSRSWLRDYLYIPLGGNRKGQRPHLRQPRRSPSCSAACGTAPAGRSSSGALCTAWGWRSSARGWTRARRGACPSRARPPGARALQRLGVFAFVSVAWVFFRADSIGDAFAVLGASSPGWGASAPRSPGRSSGLAVLGIAIQYVPRRVDRGARGRLRRIGWVGQGLVLAAGPVPDRHARAAGRGRVPVLQVLSGGRATGRRRR